MNSLTSTKLLVDLDLIVLEGRAKEIEKQSGLKFICSEFVDDGR